MNIGRVIWVERYECADDIWRGMDKDWMRGNETRKPPLTRHYLCSLHLIGGSSPRRGGCGSFTRLFRTRSILRYVRVSETVRVFFIFLTHVWRDPVLGVNGKFGWNTDRGGGTFLSHHEIEIDVLYVWGLNDRYTMKSWRTEKDHHRTDSGGKNTNLLTQLTNNFSTLLSVSEFPKLTSTAQNIWKFSLTIYLEKKIFLFFCVLKNNIAND